MSEKFSEMSELVAIVAGPAEHFENKKALIAKAARMAGVSYRTAKSLYYGEIKDPLHKAARLMKDAAERAGRQEATELAKRFEQVARKMNAADKDFYSEDVLALCHAARALRKLGMAGGDGDQ